MGFLMFGVDNIENIYAIKQSCRRKSEKFDCKKINQYASYF